MTFRCRDSNLNVFEFSVDTVEEAIQYLSDYETKNKCSTRVFEKDTGKRIVGGKLEFTEK